MKTALVYVLVMLIVSAPSALAQQRQFTDYELQDPAYRLLSELHSFDRRNSMMNVPSQDGRLLHMLVKMSGAESVLEIGTSNGVSAIWMALALKQTGGRLTTLEIDPGRAKLARENFARAGVADRIKLIEGDALQTLKKLKGTYDLVFIDAAKDQYRDYLDLIYSRIEKGGIIVAHNAVQLSSSMRDYLEHVQNHPELDTVMLTTGRDGVALSYKK